MSASKMMHQDPSSCHVLKGACRKTSSGAGKNLPNRHPRKHRFHQMIRSAVSTMFVLALLCQTAQSAAEPAFNSMECIGRIRRFKNIERILTNLVKREDWDSCDEVIKDVCDYKKWDSDMQGAYLAARKSVEAVINEYIKCQSNDQLLSDIKKDVTDFINKGHRYRSPEVLTFSCIEQLRQKVVAHLVKFEEEEEAEEDKADEDEMAAEQTATRLAAAEAAAQQRMEQLFEQHREITGATGLVQTPLLDLPSQISQNLGKVLAKYPFDEGNHKGKLFAFKLADHMQAELRKAWEIYKTHKDSKIYGRSFEAGVCKNFSQLEDETNKRIRQEKIVQKEVVIPDFLSTDTNGLLLQFDAENGDHYIISNITGAMVGTGDLNKFGKKGRQKKWIQKVFNFTGELKFYKYKPGILQDTFEEVTLERKDKTYVDCSRMFQFMIRNILKTDESGAAKEFKITEDGRGAQNLADFIKEATS